MPIEVTMPRLSDTMEQGTVVRWNVKEGQSVKSGDVLADIETDKATMELQSFDDGVVARLAAGEGTTVKVGQLILVIAAKGEDWQQVRSSGGASAAPAAARAGGAPATPAPTPSSAVAVADRPASTPSSADSGPHGHGRNGDRVFASPLARKIAAEGGVDLGGLQGTGPGGRIVRRDVEAAMRSGARPAPAAAAGAPAPLMPAPGAALERRVVALSNMRRTIAKRLVESKTTVPHYQVTVAVRMDALLALRAQLNEQLAAQGVKLSVNDFIVRACALAMHQHPYVNSRWVEPKGQDPTIEILADVNVGVAIALDESRGGGLVVGTLRHADRIGLRQISGETKRLADKARAKGLSVEEMSDSTFTISNLGMFGVEHFTAIINPPNVAILAVGAAIEKPVVEKDPKTGEKRLGVGHEMQMTMSSDHRVIDGAMAAQYLATVKDLLEKPATLLV